MHAEPERLGRYRLVREIGRGGMGTVYLGVDEGTDPPRDVAVKMLREAVHAEHATRFVNEQRVLASLDHPHIARFLEAGTAPDGRAFLVMEYVPGEPLDVYCDRRQLPVIERLRLFRIVLEAVAYAHRQLIVHRDIKPRNILVTAEGVVKLVDFGIAKPLVADPGADTAATRTGVRLMTPEYASPEQVTGGRITTATDVYALGLLLYELLCGRRAQRLAGQAPGEIERVVVHEEPPRPSATLGSTITSAGTEASAEEVAVARRTTPPRLARRLRGDLDRIVGMALRKEPERRYPSVAMLADDIDRYLAGRPVSARGDSVAYRVRKFVGRHRVAVTIAAAFVVMLAGYLVVSLRHAAELQRALEQAQVEAAKAAQVSDFLVALFDSNDPDTAQGEEVTGRELLQRGVERADQLSDEPVMQAQLLDTIGRVYRSLGEYAKARPLVERALAARRDALGDVHPDVARSHHHLGVVLRFLGDLEGSERELRRALEIDRARAIASPALAADLHDLGHTLTERGEFAEGERLFREGLGLRRTLLGDGHPDVAESLSGVAYARSRQGHPRDAVPLYAEALAIHEAKLGPRHPQVARSHQNLATVLSDLGDYTEAERHYDVALATYREVYGERHPSLAVTINNLANLKARQGDLESAERLFRQTADMRRALFGDDHPATTRAMNNLATVLLRRGKLAESEEMFRDLLEGRLGGTESQNPEVPMYKTNLSEVLRQRGRLEEAERLAREALEARRSSRGRTLETASSLSALGRVLMDRGRFDEAEPLLREALDIRRERLGDAHPEVARTREYLEDLGTRRAASR